ncbi:MAG: hypothetical protein QXF61_10375 [Nitrososphaeria archaeon]
MSLEEIGYLVGFILALAFILVIFLARKKEPKGRLIQGFVGLCSGVVTLISLFLPWIYVEFSGGFFITGIEIGEAFIYVLKNQFLKAVSYFLLLTSVLIIVGGFIHILGYKIGKNMLETAAGLSLFISVVIVLALSFIPIETLHISLESSPFYYIFGAILGVISTRLERT